MNSVSRRTLLRGLSVFGLAASAPKISPALGAGRGRVPLVVSLVLSGGSLVFSEANGVELSPYVNGSINQRNILVQNGHWRVYFRPEADNGREEVVVEYGKVVVGPQYQAPPPELSPFVATITRKDGTPVATVKVPAQYFATRWRWQSAPRPVVKTVSELIANKYLPPYGNANFPIWPFSWIYQRYTPMGNAGITVGMGTTGERPDIGPLTEWCARYILGDKSMLQQVLDQGEAAGSIPLHYRDMTTGKPVSVLDYPGITIHQNNKDSPQYMNPGERPDRYLYSPWQVAGNHFPNMSYLPFLLTRDQYHLEELQFQASYFLVANAWARDEGYGPKLYDDEERGNAWTLRGLFAAAKFSPTAADNLLPKSYFNTILANTLQFFILRMQSGDPLYTVFRMVGTNNTGSVLYSSTWQGSFFASTLAWAVLMGFTDWLPILTWKCGSLTAVIDGVSGWNRNVSDSYYYAVATNNGSSKFTSWSEAYANFAATPGNPHPGPRDALYTPNYNGDLTYPSYHRAALAMAIKAGVPDLQSAYDWYNDKLKQQSIRLGSGGAIMAKWSIV